MKYFLCLTQLACTALAQQTYPVVVEALPRLDRRLFVANGSPAAGNRENDSIGRKGYNREVVVLKSVTLKVTHISRIELAIVQLDLDFDRRVHPIGNPDTKVNGIRRTWRNLIVIQRGENGLGIASINPVSIPVQHVSINKM